MTSLKQLSSILKSVQKPGRYIGGEMHSIVKDKSEVSLRFGLCFPDVYEIGMSNLGIRILYHVLNKMPEVWCERVYTPWPDMQARMREAGIPLSAHESGDPVRDFDILGFTLQYELCYTNVLASLCLRRCLLHPLVRFGCLSAAVGGTHRAGR